MRKHWTMTRLNLKYSEKTLRRWQSEELPCQSERQTAYLWYKRFFEKVQHSDKKAKVDSDKEYS